MTPKNQVSNGSSSSSSNNVGNPYKNRSGSRGSLYGVNVKFRLPSDVYGVLRENVPNVSEVLRGLVYEFLMKLPAYLELEEVRLRVEVARLIEEMNLVHSWQNALLKHGSYAEAYLQKIKGGLITDRTPYHIIVPSPEISPEEKATVTSIVKYREQLAVELNTKLKRLLELKQSTHETATFMCHQKQNKT